MLTTTNKKKANNLTNTSQNTQTKIQKNITPKQGNKKKNPDTVNFKQIDVSSFHGLNNNIISTSNNNSSIISPKIKTKRKHGQVESSLDDIQNQICFMTNKIDDIYDKFQTGLNVKEWKEEFIFELKQENILDIDKTIPKSLNTKGSHLLQYTKFWVLFIELKYPDLDLLEIVDIFNNCLLYEQNDICLLHDYLINLFSENFDKIEVVKALEQINGKNNHFRVPSEASNLKDEHYKFLLEKPEILSASKLMPVVYKKQNTPFSSKLKNNSNRKNFNASTLFADEPIQINHNISTFNIFENNSTKKTKITKELFISKQLEFNFINTENTEDKNKIKIKNEEQPKEGVIYYNREDQKIQIENDSLNDGLVNDNSGNFNSNNLITYESLIQRNKTELSIDTTVSVEYELENLESKKPGKGLKVSKSQKNIKKKKKKLDVLSETKESEEEDGRDENQDIEEEIITKKRGKSSKNKKNK